MEGIEIKKAHRLHDAPDVNKAIAYYNRRRSPTDEALTKRSICLLVVPDRTWSTANRYLTEWSKGNPLGYRVCYGVNLCKLTGLTLEELHNID